MFIDPNTLEILSNLQNRSLESKYRCKYYEPYGHNISHSLGQRIISTSDGQFLMMESGDAGSYGITRGLMLTKLYEKYEEQVSQKVIKESTKRMVHYSEGSTGTNGYNCTYSVLGNLIELSDGYMYIGGLDKNINLDYGSGLDSPWNVFVQKYDKNFYNMDSQKDMQLLKNASIRTTIGHKPENTNLGRIYLKGNEVDNGIKWLTNLDDTRTVMLVRAVKIENDNVVILWEEDAMEKSQYGGYYLASESKIKPTAHYMIIDKDGNTIVGDTIIQDVLLSDEEQYVYKNGKIYWTSASGNQRNIYINELKIDVNPPEIQQGDVNEDEYINSTDAAMVLDLFKNGGATERDYKLGDMNDDNLLNSSDAAMILDIFKNS